MADRQVQVVRWVTAGFVLANLLVILVALNPSRPDGQTNAVDATSHPDERIPSKEPSGDARLSTNETERTNANDINR
jgi:hypothetical protein